MIEVVHDVVFETVIERRCRGLTDVPDGDRVAIGRSLGDARHADRATGAADIFNNHSLTERTAHRFSNQARNRVGGAAGRCRDDERDRPRWKSTLCRCRIWCGCGSQSEYTKQQRANKEAHRSSPSVQSFVFFKSYLFSQAHAKRAAVAARVPRWVAEV